MTEEEMVARIRSTGTIQERLSESRRRIAAMCSEKRGPRMCIPTEWSDDDIFISQTLSDAKAALEKFSNSLMDEIVQVMTRPPDLWAVNIEGPDDVYAAPTFEAAHSFALRLNEGFAAFDDPKPKAVVIRWPHNEESHRDDLEEKWLRGALGTPS